MGQYYVIVNTTKKQLIRPWGFGDGAKLLEWGCSSNGTATALAALLASGNGRGGGDLACNLPIVGSWAGDVIVVAGDYADAGEHVPPEDMARFREAVRFEGTDAQWEKEKPCLYSVACELYDNVSDEILAAIRKDPWVNQRHDLKAEAPTDSVASTAGDVRFLLTPGILRLVQGLKGQHKVEDAKPGDWVWRLRPLYRGWVVRGGALVSEDVQFLSDHIAAEAPDNTEGQGWAIDRVQLKESDFLNGELRDFDGF